MGSMQVYVKTHDGLITLHKKHGDLAWILKSIDGSSAALADEYTSGFKEYNDSCAFALINDAEQTYSFFTWDYRVRPDTILYPLSLEDFERVYNDERFEYLNGIGKILKSYKIASREECKEFLEEFTWDK